MIRAGGIDYTVRRFGLTVQEIEVVQVAEHRLDPSLGEEFGVSLISRETSYRMPPFDQTCHD
ncbi:hypothetical protein SAMN05216567_103228 [Variovorax sp. OK605]|nr:hypothetical protein SAMN05216567_103228 [Variovorax sp. OK605]